MSQLVPVDGTLIDHILGGTHELWHDGLARQPYGRFWQAQLATPWGQRRLTRWALVDGGRLLCSAKLYTFDAVLDGRALQIGGIGAVFTPIPERGRGAAADLLARLMDHASRNGYDAALLFSEIGRTTTRVLDSSPFRFADLTVRVVGTTAAALP
jgi:hypothetical protein